MSCLCVFRYRQKRGSSYWRVYGDDLMECILLLITICVPSWFQLDLDPPASSTHPGSSHKSSESPAWGVTAAPANGLETTANGVSRRGGGAWGIAGGGGQKIGGPQGANGAWGNGGVGLGSSASGAKTTVLEEALAALFRGEAVAGVKGRQNMEVGEQFYELSVRYESTP